MRSNALSGVVNSSSSWSEDADAVSFADSLREAQEPEPKASEPIEPAATADTAESSTVEKDDSEVDAEETDAVEANDATTEIVVVERPFIEQSSVQVGTSSEEAVDPDAEVAIENVSVKKPLMPATNVEPDKPDRLKIQPSRSVIGSEALMEISTTKSVATESTQPTILSESDALPTVAARSTGEVKPSPIHKPLDVTAANVVPNSDVSASDAVSHAERIVRANRPVALQRPPTNETIAAHRDTIPARTARRSDTAGAQDIQAAVDVVDALEPAVRRQSASREARSLHQHLQSALDAPRSEHSQSSPAAARAAHVDQSIRLEQAIANASQSGGDGSVKVNTGHAHNAAAILDGDASKPNLATMSSRFASEDIESPASFASQTIRGLTAMVNQRGGSMTLRLDPPELGMLRVQMTIVGGNVTAEFTAAAQHTQSLLDRSMTTLRQSLESQGLTVERLTVHAASSSSGANHSSMRNDDGASNPNQQQSLANQHDAGGSESRGRRDQAFDQTRAYSTFDARAMSFESLLGADELLTAAGAPRS